MYAKRVALVWFGGDDRVRHFPLGALHATADTVKAKYATSK